MNSSDVAPKVGSPAFSARLTALGPWWFRFEKDGHQFGGEVPRDSDKVEMFFDQAERADVAASRILEFGSHEGNHSFQLAARPEVREVIGLEAEPGNLARAEFVRQLYGAQKVQFHRRNVEHFEPAEFGSFDAVFCAGLLYHLPQPWLLLRKMAEVAPVLFLDTHYVTQATAVEAGYRGGYYDEAVTPLSGLSPRSFVFTLTDTFRALSDTGYGVRALRDIPDHGPMPRIYLFAVRDAAVPSPPGPRPGEAAIRPGASASPGDASPVGRARSDGRWQALRWKRRLGSLKRRLLG